MSKIRPPISRQSSQVSVPKSALKRTDSNKKDLKTQADNEQSDKQLQRRKSEPDLKKALQEKDKLARSPRDKLSRKSMPDLSSSTKGLRRSSSFGSLNDSPTLGRSELNRPTLQRKTSSPILRNKGPQRQGSLASVTISEDPHEERHFHKGMPPSQKNIKISDKVRAKAIALTTKKPRSLAEENQKSEAFKELQRTSVVLLDNAIAWGSKQTFNGSVDKNFRPHGLGIVTWAKEVKDKSTLVLQTTWEHGRCIEVLGHTSGLTDPSDYGIKNATGYIFRDDNVITLPVHQKNEQGKANFATKMKSGLKDALKRYLADKPSIQQDDE